MNKFQLLGFLFVVTATSLLTLPSVQATTREVCLRGCSYSTISSALLAANSGDVVHIHNGAYANEPLNVTVYSNITIRTDGHVVVSPQSDASTLGQAVYWLGIMGHITLEGDLSFSITPGGFLAPPGSFIGVVTVGGSFIQQGNLVFSFKGSHACTAIGVYGYWKQSGSLSLMGSSQAGIFVAGTWYLDTDTKVTMHLLGPNILGVFLLGATVYQYGDIDITAENGAIALYYEGSQGMKGWEQHGNLNLKLRKHSDGLAFEESVWSCYGNVTIDKDSTGYAIDCWRGPVINVVGHFDVRVGGKCYTLEDRQRCYTQETPCRH